MKRKCHYNEKIELSVEIKAFRYCRRLKDKGIK